jgi:uncharacterized protein YbcI
MIYHKPSSSSRINHRYHYYDFKGASTQNNISNTQTHITIELNKEGVALNRILMDLVPLFAYIASQEVPSKRMTKESIEQDLSLALLQPIQIDITLGKSAVKDLTRMVDAFMKKRKKAVLAIITQILEHHNDVITILGGNATTQKSTLPKFLQQAVQKTPQTFNLNTINIGTLRTKLMSLSFTTLKTVLGGNQLKVDKETKERLRKHLRAMKGLLEQLSTEGRKLTEVKEAVGNFQKKLNKIQNTLLRPSVKTHPLTDTVYNMGKNTNYKTIHGIIESLKSEIDSIVKALATAEEPVSKVVQEEITQTIAESAATSLAPTHPDLENLREQIRAAETSVAALVREKEELESRINTVVSEKNTIEKSKKHANATIATLTASLKEVENRITSLRSNKNVMEKTKNASIASLTASLRQVEKRIASLRSNKNAMERRKNATITSLKASLNREEKRVANSQQSIEALRREKSDLEKRIASLRSNKNVMEKRKNASITSLTASLRQVEKRIASLRSNKNAMERRKNATIASLKALYNMEQKRVSNSQQSIEALRREKSDLEKRIATLRSNKNAMERRKDAAITSLKASLNREEKRVANSQESIEALRRERSDLQNRIASLRSNKSAMERGKNATITSLTVSLKQTESRLAAERLEVQKLKKRLRVYTGIIISGAAATGALYTAGLYKTSPRNMPRTKNNVKAFMNATQTFNTNTYMRQALGGTSKNGGKLPASVRSGRNRVAATPLLPAGMGTGSTNPAMLRLPPGSSASGSARPNTPTQSSSIVSVPAAVALVGGAYLAKKFMGRKGKIPIQKSTTRNSMTANESWIRGQSQNVRGNIYNNNTNNTARSLTPSERAVKLSKEAGAFMRRQKFPEPRNTLYYSKEAVRRAKEAGNYRRRQRF